MIRNKKEPLFLLLGDVVLFFLALFVTLMVRYGGDLTRVAWEMHVLPFSLLFCVWVVVFFVAGLYGKHTLILKSRLPATIVQAQLLNILLAIAFFYLVPFFGITPKTNLFLYLLLSSIFILLWRLYGHALVGLRRKTPSLLLGTGSEMRDVLNEVNNNKRYGVHFVSYIDLGKAESFDVQKDIVERILTEGIGIVVLSMHDSKVAPFLPSLYNLMLSGVRFINLHKMYEDIFDRVPLSVLHHSWFLENISFTPHVAYDVLKRVLDCVVALVALILTLPLFPFIALAIVLDDGGCVFYSTVRVGAHNRPIRLFKFRSMREMDQGEHYGDGYANRETRVGTFLRRSRLDELPQLWNVLRGELSISGPRPELPALVAEYDKEIPYYHVRHLIKPGLSGWAQINHHEHPHHALDVEQTGVKLSYDVYYIKNRSFLLDFKIVLQTVKIVLAREGR